MRLAASVLAVLLLSPGLLAQQLEFPQSATTDKAALAKGIAALARQMLEQHQDPNRESYLSTRLRLQIAAGEYDDAVETFAQWRELRPPAPGFDPAVLQELYAKSKAAEARGVPFGQAFGNTFAAAFAPFDDRKAMDQAFFLQTPGIVFRRPLEQSVAQASGNTLTFAQGFELIRNYVASEAIESIAPFLNEAVTADDKRRYDIQYDALIKTKEGATLSAMVVRKKGTTEPLPTSLFFNIYTDVGYNLPQAKAATLYGYVGVAADARGKRLSPDEITPWETEAKDTYGIIDWISKQPWSNGKVGMHGSSYIGFAQWAAAKSLHPALKTIVPSVASFPGFGLPMQNNVFSYANYAWPFYVMNNKYLDEETYNDNARWNALNQKWYASGRPYREIDAIDGTPNKLLQRQMQHPSLDAYWQAMQPYQKDYAKIDIPVLSLTGYFDDANPGAVNYLRDHYEHNKNANHYLVIGPYDHVTTKQAVKPPVVRGYSIDPVAQLDTVALTYRWFDYVMKGGPKPEILEDRINFQVMGANQWRHAPSIDAMSNEKLRLYLTDTREGERYRLAPGKPARRGFLEQTVNFADRSTENNLYIPWAIVQQFNDTSGFTFVSDPFDTPVSMDGMITGQLNASINKKDMDVALAVYELMPDGDLFYLAYYVGRASYAHDMSRRQLLTPGKKASIPFERTQLISRQMSKGSRIFMRLTVNKNVWAQVNHGTGKDVSDESIADAGDPLQVRWHTDSYITVPITRQPKGSASNAIAVRGTGP